ncbi:MAG: holo-ACP synthase [Cocleimonas sp.]|nr:holo-ACP synthase [Cocleimonas sp.]
MIKGIGTDIVDVERIESALVRNPDAFSRRVLHPNELKIFANHKQPCAYLAKRFAAKEALSKALGTGIAKGVSFHEIEVKNDALGRPLLELHQHTKAIADSMGVTSSFLTLADEKHYAIAYVVLEGEE